MLGDFGLGIITFVWVSLAYEHATLPAFALAVILSFAPDLDALAEISRRGKVAASADNPMDHREMLHKPLIWLAITGGLWAWLGYYGAIAFFVILLHFLHDSVLTGWGVPWLAPFSKTRFKFFVDETNKESWAREDWMRRWTPQKLTRMIIAYGDEYWIEHLYLRPTVVSVTEYTIFLASLGLLTWYLLA
jgi:hypothetical protein